MRRSEFAVFVEDRDFWSRASRKPSCLQYVQIGCGAHVRLEEIPFLVLHKDMSRDFIAKNRDPSAFVRYRGSKVVNISSL